MQRGSAWWGTRQALRLDCNWHPDHPPSPRCSCSADAPHSHEAVSSPNHKTPIPTLGPPPPPFSNPNTESPSGLVAEAAGLALSALVRHGRYDAAGPGDLVSQNADYIVDGLCRQLRQPARHPRAPALFAALLKQTGVPQMLLPLLAEPLRVALQVSLFACVV